MKTIHVKTPMSQNRESCDTSRGHVAAAPDLLSALTRLHAAVSARMAADEPSGDQRLELLKAWEEAGNLLSDAADVCTDRSARRSHQPMSDKMDCHSKCPESERQWEGSLARELAHPESMLRLTLVLQVARLRALADAMEEEGKCLKILGTTEKRIPHAFSRGAEMCGAADMERDWAANLEALLPNAKSDSPANAG